MKLAQHAREIQNATPGLQYMFCTAVASHCRSAQQVQTPSLRRASQSNACESLMHCTKAPSEQWVAWQVDRMCWVTLRQITHIRCGRSRSSRPGGSGRRRRQHTQSKMCPLGLQTAPPAPARCCNLSALGRANPCSHSRLQQQVPPLSINMNLILGVIVFH